MFSKAVQNAKDDLAGILHGTTVNKITNINALLDRAMRTTLTRIDPSETHRRFEITLQEDVIDYDAPEDLKDRKITDFYPQADRTRADNPRIVVGNEFDRLLEENTIRVVIYDGTKSLRIKKSVTENTDYYLDYYSEYGFRTADGTTWHPNVSAAGGDNALINLGLTSYEIWLYEAAILCAQQQQGKNSSNDVTFFRDILYGSSKAAGLYAEYLEGEPDEAIAPRQTWY